MVSGGGLRPNPVMCQEVFVRQPTPNGDMPPQMGVQPCWPTIHLDLRSIRQTADHLAREPGRVPQVGAGSGSFDVVDTTDGQHKVLRAVAVKEVPATPVLVDVYVTAMWPGTVRRPGTGAVIEVGSMDTVG